MTTGGSSTELFLPSTGKSCSLKSLPLVNYQPTLDPFDDGLITCGGTNSQYQMLCHKFTPSLPYGTWSIFTTMIHKRRLHTSLSTGGRLLLVGGYYSASGYGGGLSNAELLGGSTIAFNLKHKMT